MGRVNPAGGSGTVEGRDGWCTPRWLADVIGPVDLDPCSNSRSHIEAMWKVRQDLGADGLGGTLRGEFRWAAPTPPALQVKATLGWRVFINPPYSRGEVVKWVRHYAHTNFLFLLRWAPDTEWFAELWPHCWGVWFPNRRINFEPPPGVRSSSNPYPHALYLAKTPTGDFLDRLLANGYLVRNERQRRRDTVHSPAYPSVAGGAGGGGAAAGSAGCSTCQATREGLLVLCATHAGSTTWPAARRTEGGEGPGR